VPYQQQLQPADCADRLRKLRLPFDNMAADKQSAPLKRGTSVCTVELRQLPYAEGVGYGEFRPHLDGLSADERACERSVRFVPYQQQLQPADCADGMRNVRLPHDDVAADKQSGALDGRAGICADELLELPHDEGVGCSFVRS
jgi:hypothetical protein